MCDPVESLRQAVADTSQSGHFVFESGMHGSCWLDLDRLLAESAGLQFWIAELAARSRALKAQVVCGPETGGARLAAEIAKLLDCVAVASKRVVIGSRVRYHIEEGDRFNISGRGVLLVDDAINAGHAVVATAEQVMQLGGSPVGVTCLVTCSPMAHDMAKRLNVPLEYLLNLDHPVWHPDECPLCRAHHNESLRIRDDSPTY